MFYEVIIFVNSIITTYNLDTDVLRQSVGCLNLNFEVRNINLQTDPPFAQN